MNTTHSWHAWVRQDELSSWPGSCIHVMLQLDRMSQFLDQEVVFMSCSSQAGRVNFMIRQEESCSWRGGCIIVMLQSTWIQLPGQELNSSCLTQACHECNFLVKNLTPPAWLQHDNYTTSCSWTWLILSDWSMTWIHLPGQELCSSCLTQTWHEYNFL
jgi:hypothetical protein